MSKMILEKNPVSHKFVSPSAATDHKSVDASGINLDWKVKTGLGVVAGFWALRRFPVLTLLGAAAYGIYKGMNSSQSGGGKNPFKGEGIAKDFLH